MTEAGVDLIYTFLGVRIDGTVPVADIGVHTDDAGALASAEGWLREHTSCTAVEIWRDNDLIGRVGGMVVPTIAQQSLLSRSSQTNT